MAASRGSTDCPPDEDFYCPICQEVFQTPVKTLSCDHMFCRKCFQTALKSAAVCPLCRGKVSKREISMPQRATGMDENMRKCYGSCKCCGEKVKYYRMRHHYTMCWKYQQEFGSTSKDLRAGADKCSSTQSALQLFDCPACMEHNLDRKGLLAHFNREHIFEIAELECPICVSLPWAEPHRERRNLLDHLNRRHCFDYDEYMSPHLDEATQLEAALAESYFSNF
ncbi:E3 ubiquitin-protein ligase RNF138-like [Ambystoma mexicanum]|uniref:E3 ubiquitin-protein ligase RNF138-like n=1 Tax=Ambystoma mexicanum TaxID=8296 RepID=UPI0037E7FEBD